MQRLRHHAKITYFTNKKNILSCAQVIIHKRLTKKATRSEQKNETFSNNREHALWVVDRALLNINAMDNAYTLKKLRFSSKSERIAASS